MAANRNLADAIHAMTVLACIPERIRSNLIAGSINTNPALVRKILSKLVHAKLVRSYAGKNGGFTLAKPSDQIDLFEIHKAVGDDCLFAICSNPENPKCQISRQMKKVLSSVFVRAKKAVESELKRTTLADVVNRISK